MLTYKVSSGDHCRSAESFLRNLLPTATGGYLHKLLKNGHLLLNGVPVPGEALLRLDDTLALKESGKTAAFLLKKAGQLDILYEDDYILIVNKEPGLAVHLSAEDGDRNLVAVAERHLILRGVSCKLRPVNRIDRGTSGAVILAKSATAAGMFGRFVKEVGLGKVYLAAVEGVLAPEGVIDLPLDDKESLTRYRLLSQGDGAAVAAVYPVSGRTHQIRRHFSAIGHPILGDFRYGGPSVEGYAGHGLHAFAVGFKHPVHDTDLVFHAPLPSGLLALFEQVVGRALPQVLATLPDLPLQATAG